MMLEKMSRRLVPFGQTHAWLKWPILGLLMLVLCVDCAWAFARCVGKETLRTFREAGAHLGEAGLTPQGIHDNVERLVDAGIRAASRVDFALAMARGRSAYRAAAQWCTAHIRAGKTALAARTADAKAAGGELGRGLADRLTRLGRGVRADLPQLRRHAPRRAMAAALTVCMVLTLLPVSAFAEGTGCTHTHDASCYRQELTCDKEETEGHTHGDGCYTKEPICGVAEAEAHTHGTGCYVEKQTCTLAEHAHGEGCVERTLTCEKAETEGHTHGDACYTAEPVCGLAEAEAHAHSVDCYNKVLDCEHVCDAACGGLKPTAPECDCGAVPDADGNTVHGESCSLYTAPTEPACDCGAVPDVDGNTVHAEGCPLYTAPAVKCATCGEGHDVADCPVEAVRALIDALPSPEAISAMTEDERTDSGIYDALDAAYNAYDALTPFQKSHLSNAEATFAALGAALGAVPVPMAITTEISITTADDMTALANAINNNMTSLKIGDVDYTIAVGGAGTTFTLTCDINLSNNLWTPIGKNYGVLPQPTFKGTFDGGGFTISNMKAGGFKDAFYQGLFGVVNTGATVKNVTVKGTVEGWQYLGGIAGQSAGTIENCVNYVAVSGASGTTVANVYAGGIAGRNSGMIKACVNYGTISNKETTSAQRSGFGGIVGSSGGTIEQCYNAGPVSVTSGSQSGGGWYAGGIAGSVSGAMKDCYNTASIQAYSRAGGIAGEVNGYAANIIRCYSTGNVASLTSPEGGIVGELSYGSVSDCVALPPEMKNSSAKRVIGLLVSGNSPTMTDLYARSDMLVKGALVTDGKSWSEQGADIAIGTALSTVFTSSWDTTIWEIPTSNLTGGGALPTLKALEAIKIDQNPVLLTLPTKTYHYTIKANSSTGYDVSGTKSDGVNESTYTVATAQTLSNAHIAISQDADMNPYTIKLESDITAKETLTLAKNVTLDLNGQTLTTYHIECSTGTALTIMDSSGKSGKLIGNDVGLIALDKGTKLTLKSGTLEQTTGSRVIAGADATSVITIDGGTVKNSGTGSTRSAIETEGQLIITGGTVSCGVAAPAVNVSGEGTVTLSNNPTITTVSGQASISVAAASAIHAKKDSTYYSGGNLTISYNNPSTADNDIIVTDLEDATQAAKFSLVYPADRKLKYNSTNKTLVLGAALIDVNITFTDKTTLYAATMDIAKLGLFTIPPEAGAATYTVTTGTGTGTLSGTTLSVTKVGTFTVKVDTAATETHKAGTATAGLTINKAPAATLGDMLTITPYSGTYDGEEHDFVAVSGQPTGSTVTYSQVSEEAGFYATMPKQTNATSGMSFWVRVEHPNYETYTSDGNFVKIEKVTLTPTLNMSGYVAREYNTSTTVAGAKITLTGAVKNETPSATATFNFDSADAGKNKAVSVTGIALPADKAVNKNYKLSVTKLENQPTNAEVKPKEVAVQWDTAASYTYTGADQGDTVKAYFMDVKNQKVDLAVSFLSGQFKDALTHIAIATTTDSNYTLTLATKTKSLTIGKAASAIAAPAKVSATSTSVTLTAVTPSEGGGTVEYAKSATSTAPTSGWQSGTEFTGLTANTSYYFFARVNESANYLAATSTGTEISTLDKALTSISVTSPTKTAYVAFEKLDRAGMVVTAHYDDGTSASVTSFATVTYAGGDSFRAGDTSVTLGYGGKTCTLSGLTVSKAPVTAPTIASKVYTGNTLTAEVAASDTYTATTNVGGTNVGNYNVVLTLSDTDNYKWSDSEDAAKTLTFAITQATNAWSTPLSCADITFGDEPAPAAAANFGTPDFTYSKTENGEYSATLPDSAVDWWVKASVVGTTNYTAIDNNVKFTVSQKAYDASAFTIADIQPQSFTGVEIKPTPEIKWGEIPLVNETDYDLTYEANTAVGEKTAKVKIVFKGNYSGDAEVTFSIVENPLEASQFETVFGMSDASLKLWHNKDIVLTAQTGWTIGTSATDLGQTVTLSTEGSAVEATIYAKGDGKVYLATVYYKLDKTPPTVGEVTGNPTDWTNQDVTLQFNPTDGISGPKQVSVKSGDNTILHKYENGKYNAVITENKVVTITARDEAGNTSDPVTVTVSKIDKTAPVISSVTPSGTMGQNDWYTTDVTVTATATDEQNGSAIKEYSFDGGTTWQPESAKTYSTNGSHTVTVWVRDHAGNETKQDAITVKMDTEKPAAPTVTVQTGDETYTGGWTAKDVVFTLSGTATTSGHAKYQVKVGDAEWADMTGSTYTVSENTPGDDGVNYAFRAVNNAGTEGTASTDTLVKRRSLDESVKDDPANKYVEDDLTHSGTLGQNGWFTGDMTITVKKKDKLAENDAKTYYTVDGGAKIELTGAEIKITTDGTHAVVIWTEDAAGNETTKFTVTIEVDQTAPTVSDTLTPSVAAGTWTRDDITVSFDASDATSGIETVQFKKDDGAWTDCTKASEGSYSFSATENGTYTVRVTDKAGKTTEKTVTIANIDKTAPTADFGTLPTLPDSGWYTAEVTIPVTVSDTNLKDWYYSLGGESWTKGESNSFVITANGTHAVKVKAVDKAGNETLSDAITVKLDTATPVAPTVTVQADGKDYKNDWTAADVVFTLAGTATTSGLAKYQVKVGTADWADVTGNTYTVTDNTPGDDGVNYAFRTVNNAGTEGTASTNTLVKRRALGNDVLDSTDNKYVADNLTIGGAAIEDGWYTEDETITVAKKDKLAGNEADTYYTLGTGVETKLTGEKIEITTEGTHTLTIWTKDAAGNTTTKLAVTIMLDKTAPVISDVSGSVDAWQNTDVTLTIAATDATAGLAELPYSFDSGTTWQSEATKAYAANTTIAENTIQVKDAAGNIAKHATEIKIEKIDKDAPTVSITPEVDSEKWYGKTEFTATSADATSGVKSVSVSGGKLTDADITSTGRFDADETEAKDYTYTVTVTDNAGNTKTASVTVHFDPVIDAFAKVVTDAGTTELDKLLSALDTYAKYTDDQKTHLAASEVGSAAKDALDDAFTAKQDELVGEINGIIEKHPGTTTLADIDKAEELYKLLDDQHKKDVVEGYQQMLTDRDAAKEAIKQLSKEDPTYEEQQTAKNTYDSLSENQQKLVENVADMADKVAGLTEDVNAVDAVIEKINDVKKPYNSESITAIEDAKKALDELSDGQKGTFPAAEEDRLEALYDAAQAAKAVENAIAALTTPYDNTQKDDILMAQSQLTGLSDDAKAMVSTDAKTKLDTLVKAVQAAMTADEKAAAAFAEQLTQTVSKPTVSGIEALQKAHDALSEGAKGKLTQAQKDAYNKLVALLTDEVKKLVTDTNALDIGKLTPTDKSKIAEVETTYNDLTNDQKKLVDSSTGGKLAQLVQAVKDAATAEKAIADIPRHDDASGVGTSCESQSHTIAEHKNAIETAKLTYERLTDAGRALVAAGAKTKLNTEYAALMAYLEYKNTADTSSTKVEIAGLAEKVQAPATAPDVTKTVIKVAMKDDKTDKVPETIADKKQALSVDIKLEAQSYKGETLVGNAVNVQPKQGETVLVKLKVPAGYQNDTLEIWHVKESGVARQVSNFWLVTETDGTYAVFEVASFSHFVLYAEETPSQPSHGGDSYTPGYTPGVSTGEHGSVSTTPKAPAKGDKVTITVKPDEGYVVDQVIVTDKDGKDIPVQKKEDGSFTFVQPAGKVDIAVTFKPAGTGLPFTDMTEDDWFYDSVKCVSEKGLMVGTSDTTFGPNLNTTRGMIVTILWRLAGEPEAKTAASFADVSADAYYAKAVAWAAETGIVKGYDANRFGPGDAITREQLAAMLYRYAQHSGMDATAKGDLTRFSDQPSAWALEPMTWAVGAGILSGKGDGILAPTSPATRAETAKMLLRFLS